MYSYMYFACIQKVYSVTSHSYNFLRCRQIFTGTTSILDTVTMSSGLLDSRRRQPWSALGSRRAGYRRHVLAATRAARELTARHSTRAQHLTPQAHHPNTVDYLIPRHTGNAPYQRPKVGLNESNPRRPASARSAVTPESSSVALVGARPQSARPVYRQAPDVGATSVLRGGASQAVLPRDTLEELLRSGTDSHVFHLTRASPAAPHPAASDAAEHMHDERQHRHAPAAPPQTPALGGPSAAPARAKRLWARAALLVPDWNSSGEPPDELPDPLSELYPNRPRPPSPPLEMLSKEHWLREGSTWRQSRPPPKLRATAAGGAHKGVLTLKPQISEAVDRFDRRHRADCESACRMGVAVGVDPTHLAKAAAFDRSVATVRSNRLAVRESLEFAKRIYGKANPPKQAPARKIWRLEESIWAPRVPWNDAKAFYDTVECARAMFDLDWRQAVNRSLDRFIERAAAEGDGEADVHSEVAEVAEVLWEHHECAPADHPAPIAQLCPCTCASRPSLRLWHSCAPPPCLAPPPLPLRRSPSLPFPTRSCWTHARRQGSSTACSPSTPASAPPTTSTTSHSTGTRSSSRPSVSSTPRVSTRARRRGTSSLWPLTPPRHAVRTVRSHGRDFLPSGRAPISLS